MPFHAKPLPRISPIPRGRAPGSVVRSVFGFEALKPIQEAAISSLTLGRDVLATMPTGGGKSLVYQVPALVLPGTAVVISPLIALMRDQADALRAKGVRAAALASRNSMEAAETREILDALRQDRLDILYLSPERLASDSTMDALLSTRISFVAIDEAHCIVEWGHDFRPDYLRIPENLAPLGRLPRVALTASATPAARMEIRDLLLSPEAVQLSGGFDRPNIFLEVAETLDPLSAFLGKLSTDELRLPAVAYVPTRIEAERSAAALSGHGMRAAPYHAGLPDPERNATQDAFLRGDVDVVVATSAFGMGIDKADVETVAHLGLPSSVEAYYQEIGRAGRDGRNARAFLAWGGSDFSRRRGIARSDDPGTTDRRLGRLHGVMGYVSTPTCRRAALLGRFGEIPVAPCGKCDRCLSPVAQDDASNLPNALLAAVGRLSGDATPDEAVSFLTGESQRRFAGVDVSRTPQMGAFGGLGRSATYSIMWECIGLGLVEIDDRDGRVALTPAGYETLRAGRGVPTARGKAAGGPRAETGAPLPEWRKALWTSLVAPRPVGLGMSKGLAARVVAAAGGDDAVRRTLFSSDEDLVSETLSLVSEMRDASRSGRAPDGT